MQKMKLWQKVVIRQARIHLLRFIYYDKLHHLTVSSVTWWFIDVEATWLTEEGNQFTIDLAKYMYSRHVVLSSFFFSS